MSKDAVAVATLFGSVLLLRLMFGSIADAAAEFMAYCISLCHMDLAEPVPANLFVQTVMVCARTVGPLLAVTVLVSVVATFAQTKMLVTVEPIKPKFEKINPLKGFKRLFSLKSLVEAVKNILKITILLFLIYTCVRDLTNVVERYLYADVYASCVHFLNAIFSMLMKVGLAFVALAALDFMYQWWDYERQMKMSKQEVKEEYKQTEGDPQIKGKIKQLQRQMSQARMMQQVPGADVVVRNPTHFAVALRYHPGEDDAPVVLAKGQDLVAQRIVQVAEENDIIVIENVPLARALYAETELNRMIPPDLYEAVADVMIYLYKLGRLKGEAPKEDA